ncbi:MAG: hypothetical protein KF746_12295 [Chitinophagaceae bacterium]|nr:hypothetical protein [Chitinophagaceae bacterium]
MNISLLKLICALQFALAGYMTLNSFVYIFNEAGWHSIVSFIAFCFAVYLTSFVWQVIYKNYPDMPLSLSQKTTFNWLFILNFFLLSALLTYNINDVKLVTGLSGAGTLVLSPLFYASVLLHLLVTIFQVYILLGMVKLRRTLNRNFEKKAVDMEVLQA